MNFEKLKACEHDFLMRYPDGFRSPEMEAQIKKHKIEKMEQMAQETFSKGSLKQPEAFCEMLIRLVSQSSIVSVFEKPKFRDAIRAMSFDERKVLAQAYHDLFYGDEEKGFNQLTLLLKSKSIAKWPVITAPMLYFRPNFDVIIKPTTVKAVISYFDISDLTYRTDPSYAFYKGYRACMLEMKKILDPSISISNGMLSGFLMICMESSEEKVLE